jgi:hypothetical protein
MKIPTIILVTAILILASCNSRPNKLANRWVLIKGTSDLLSDIQSQIYNFPVQIIDFTQSPLSGSFIQLNPFGKYNLRISTIYSEGKWKRTNDSTLILVATTADTIPIRVMNCDGDTLKIKFLTGHNFSNYLNYLSNDITLTFVSDTIWYFKTKNPYSLKYNQWAVKAKHKLTEAEIREKLLNYIDYLLAILKDPRDNSKYLDKITNPITIAANGISIKRKDDVDPEWQNLFYDKEGFETAYHILQNTFLCDVRIIEASDFIALDVDILKQIREIINRKKKCE